MPFAIMAFPASWLAARAESYFRSILEEIDVEIGGDRPWDLQVHDERFFVRAARHGSLGVGESYMDGWWDADDLAELVYRLLRWRNEAMEDRERASPWPRRLNDLRRRLFNLQSRSKAEEVVDAHYDLPAELFDHMLGETMAYSCGYWRDLTDDVHEPEPSARLDDAQRRKLDLICRKLELEEDDLVLDLGCGFGSFSRFAAENYGCKVVAVNLSRSQLAYARKFCDGLPVEFHRCDVREPEVYAKGRVFDKVASIAMFEAVGRKNFRHYMELVHGLLRDGGRFLLHTLGDRRCSSNPWMDKYIFPNGELPTVSQVNDAILDLFHLEDFHSFGQDYSITLRAWEENFRRHWETIRAVDPKRFGERFFRMWIFYLSSCSAALRSRTMYLWHFVMTKGYPDEIYRSVR